MISQALQSVGATTLDFFGDIGRLSRLAGQAVERTVLGGWRGYRFRPRLALDQVSRAGEESLPLVGLIAFLIGMILALQSAYQLKQLGAIHLVADLVAVSVFRELAPLMTAILVAGRVGSAIAAELGTMKVSDEVDALNVMGIDPISFLVVPRVLGLLVAVPCLTLFADLAGILGGGFVAATALDLGFQGYWHDSLAALSLEDLWSGVAKAICFGGLIALVSCQKGLDTHGGANEVGRSTTSAVVRSIVFVIAADLVFTAWFFVRD